MSDLVQNLSKITTIPEPALNKLVDKASMCIAHAALNLGEEPATVDVGIGVLAIGSTAEGVRYKFIPSKNLDQMVHQAISGVDTLTCTCEQALVDRILNTYKTLF